MCTYIYICIHIYICKYIYTLYISFTHMHEVRPHVAQGIPYFYIFLMWKQLYCKQKNICMHLVGLCVVSNMRVSIKRGTQQ